MLFYLEFEMCMDYENFEIRSKIWREKNPTKIQQLPLCNLHTHMNLSKYKSWKKYFGWISDLGSVGQFGHP